MGNCTSAGGGAGGRAGGAEQTAEYKYERLIGNGRTGRSELDNAETVEQVRQIESTMKNIIQQDRSLDKQGKTTLNGATERRVDEAVVRVSPVSNRKEMVSFIKQQTGVDITPYIEERAGHSRSYLGVHIEQMPKTDQIRLRNIASKKGIRIEDNGGFGSTLNYIKKKK